MTKSTTQLAILAVVVVWRLADASPAVAQLFWEELASFLDPRTGSGIEGASASLIGDSIYVSNGHRVVDSDFLSIYDIPTNTWTHGGPTAPDSPGPARSEGAGGTVGGLHYAIGGRPGATPTGDVVEEFTPGGGWVLKDAMPTPRRGLGTASLGGLIYAVGGSSGFAPGDPLVTGALEVFDPSAAAGSQWTALAPLPIPVLDAEATIALGPAESGLSAGAVYVFGGLDGFGTTIAATQIYDIAAGLWSFGAAMPTARSNAMAGLVDVGAVEDGMIAVFGGADPSFMNLTVTELYDPLTDTWTPGPPMLFPTSEQAVGVTYDSTGIYSIGSGIFGPSEVVVERLTPIVVPPPEPTTPAALDIKPGSDPNAINLSSMGVQPVAILTTADFDATTVDTSDLSTIQFGDPNVVPRVSPFRAALEDVDGDGDIDLIMHFSTPEITSSGALLPVSTEAELTAVTPGGFSIAGLDSVRIVPPGDANIDQIVNAADYTIWADGFGTPGGGLENGDFNEDGLVDAADYTIWADNFGADLSAPGSAPAAVPEPSTFVLSALGLIGLLAYGWRRRRRA